MNELKELHARDVPEDDPDWLTMAEAAELAGVRTRTVRAWCTKGYLERRTVRNGYHVRVHRPDLIAFLRDRSIAKGPGVRRL